MGRNAARHFYALPVGYVLAACISWAMAASPAHAEDAEQTASARQLFGECIKASDEERWEQAAHCYRKLLILKESPAARYNMASALAQLGALVEASEALNRVLGEDSAPAELREEALKLLGEITPRIGKITIRTQGDITGVTIFVGARPITLEAIGRPVPIDPGSWTVTAYRNSQTIATANVVVAEGRGENVVLRLPASPASVPTAALVASAPYAVSPAPVLAVKGTETAGARDTDEGSSSVWLWTGIGAAVVVVATVVIVVLASGSGGGRADPVEGNFGSGVVVIGD